MVKSGQAWAGLVVTRDATGALAAASVGPAGTLYVNGTANGASVTITGSNPYKWAVTLPSLTAGDSVSMYITATVGGIASAAVVAEDVADTKRVSDLNDAAAALDAAGTRAAVGLSAANLDSQLGAISAKTTNLSTDPADQSLLEAAITAATSPLATAANLATLTGYVDTEVAAILAAVDTEIAAIKAKTDGLPAIPAGVGDAMTLANDAITAAKLAADAVAEIATAIRTELATELARIDAATSTRLATAGYTAPPSAATVASQVDVTLSAAHGSGPWGGSGAGTGTGTYTDTVTDGADPLDNVLVQLSTDAAGTNMAYKTYSAADGSFTMRPDPGTYYVWFELAGYSFTQGAQVVVT